MAFWDNWVSSFADKVAAGVINRTAVQPIIEARAYRQGMYKPQLRVKAGQFDDNVGLPFVGLVASRIVGQMIGRGVELDFEGDTETANELYIKAVLKANKEELLLHRAGLSAVESGTGYLLIIPDGIKGDDGVIYPRLQIVDPAYVKMDALPEDYEAVIRYTIEYKFKDDKDKEQSRRKIIEHNSPETLEDGTFLGGNTWTVSDWEETGFNKWTQVGKDVLWDYDFPPIIHWQSLPSVASAYGEPDISPALIELQERLNFTASNESKIIRLHAHPMRVGRGVTSKNMELYDAGPEKILLLSDKDTFIEQLAPLGDLAATSEFLKMLKQTLFDVSRLVDIDSMGDKLGTLTNFGLRVLYQDNLTMIATKRELFGDMLEELARRLQALANMTPLPCKCVWPEFLPESEVEEQAALQGDLNMGVVSRQTVAQKRGYDWEEEQSRIEDEKASDDNVGAALLRGFTQGGGGFNLPVNNNLVNEESNNG